MSRIQEVVAGGADQQAAPAVGSVLAEAAGGGPGDNGGAGADGEDDRVQTVSAIHLSARGTPIETATTTWVYLARARIFLLFRLSRRMRFFLHFALISNKYPR